jgi:hypothetical protein
VTRTRDPCSFRAAIVSIPSGHKLSLLPALLHMSTPPPFIPPERFITHAPPPTLRELDEAPPPSGPSPARAAPPGPAEEREGRGSRGGEIAQLRILAAEATDLRGALERVQTGESPLAQFAEYIGAAVCRVDALVEALPEDDCTRRIRNAWDQIRTSKLMRDPETEFPAQEQMQLLSSLEAQCRQVVFWSAYKTIPFRLRDWLSASQPGYAVPFHAVFEDEIPDEEDRQKILNHLAWSPALLKDPGGLVDPQSGLVYRYDSESGTLRQLSAFAWLLLGIGVGALAIYVVALEEPLNMMGHVLPHLYTGWAALLIGMLVSVGIGTARRVKAQGSTQTVMPISRALIMLNARIGFIMFRLFIALIGFFALLYAVGFTEDTMNTFLFNCFLVGYSLDTVVDMLGNSLDQRAGAQQGSLSTRLNG